MTPGGEDLKGAFACAGRDACEELLRAVFAEPDEAGAALKVYLRNFSSFNETFGYKRGEALLSEVVAWLAEIPGALVFRAGGGVAFILVLRGAGPVEATAVAQRIADRFEEPWPIGDIDCVLSADTGVVLYPQYAESPGDLFRNLDLALGQSGKMPPGQVTLFGPALKERLYRNSMIAKLLVNAVAQGNIELRYRPTFCSATNTYSRVECQVRLLTVEFGPIKSVEFIPIAEESGIICFVNSHVLRSACALIRELLSSGCRFESMAVQVSPVMLLQQRFVADVAELLREYNIPEGKLALEIYDSPVMAPVARKVMERLNDLGVELILGGFDFGPSGFKNMMTMPVDAIKLGRHFIWQLETNPRSGPVIEALIQAAGRLGIKLIAEGVETEQQNSLLTRYKCPYRQGFYYSPSVDLTELRQILEREDG